MTNYEKGVNLERLFKKFLESNGWTVVRSAGSKSNIDLVGWREDMFCIVQCKVQKRKISYVDEITSLKEVHLPIAAGLHTERLLVVKTKGSILVKNVDTGGCIELKLKDLKECR